MVKEIDRLLDDHTEGEVAAILNEKGLVSGWGRSFDGRRVRVTRRLYNLKSRYARLQEAGFLKLREAAKKLGICRWTVKERRAAGKLPMEVRKLNDTGEYMYKDPEWKE